MPSSAPPAPRRSTPAPTGGGSRSLVPDGLRAASEWTVRLVVVVFGIMLLGRLAGYFSEITIPLLVGLLLCALLNPAVAMLQRLRLPRGLASITALLGLLLVVVALFSLVGQQIAAGFSQLYAQALAGLQEVEQWMAGPPLRLSTDRLTLYVTQLQDSMTANRERLFTGALGIAATATHIVAGFFVTMFATFFFLAQGRAIWTWLLRFLPGRSRHNLDDAARGAWVTLTAYVRATMIVALVDGIGVAIVAAVLRVPLAMPLGLLVFLGAFIPIVGALLTGVVAVLVALVAVGWIKALIMLGGVILVNQIESHGLQPFLLGRAVRVHPLAVIVAITAGITLGGIVGGLFAVPLMAVANTMMLRLSGRADEDAALQAARTDAPLAPDDPRPVDAAQRTVGP